MHVPTNETAVYEHSDLREFFSLLKRHAVLIAVVTIVTGAATYAVTSRQAKQYTSGSTLLYSAASSSEDPTRAIDTLAGVGSSSAVLAPVASRYGLTLSELQGALTVTADSSADLVSISVNLGSPVKAAKIANYVASALISYSATGQKRSLQAQINTLEHELQAFAGRIDPSSLAAASDLRLQLAQARAALAVAAPSLSVLSPALTPTSPISPHPKRDAAIGILAGLVLGVMLGAFRDRLDRRIRGIEQVEAIYRAPTLGVVPFTKGRRRSRANALADFSGSGPLADAYRTIRTNLTLLSLSDDENQSTVVVVTSATAEEGKSTVTANLAHALSVTGRRVLAVSADLHNPTLHEYFVTPSDKKESRVSERQILRAPPTVAGRVGTSRLAKLSSARGPVGLVQVLADEVELSEAVRVIPLPELEQARGGSLHVLADATRFFDPTALLSSGSMQKFLKQASYDYDVIVLDTPPVLANADAMLLAQGANVVVLVARLDHLTKNQARRAVQVMKSTNLLPTGVIVTGEIDEPVYGYGYRLEYEGESALNGADDRAQTSA